MMKRKQCIEGKILNSKGKVVKKLKKTIECEKRKGAETIVFRFDDVVSQIYDKKIIIPITTK